MKLIEQFFRKIKIQFFARFYTVRNHFEILFFQNFFIQSRDMSYDYFLFVVEIQLVNHLRSQNQIGVFSPFLLIRLCVGVGQVQDIFFADKFLHFGGRVVGIFLVIGNQKNGFLLTQESLSSENAHGRTYCSFHGKMLGFFPILKNLFSEILV